MSPTFDPYRELGVTRDADAVTIKKAFRRLAKAHHPDRGGDPERFKAINRANEVLADPERRSLFDRFGPAGLQPGFDPAMAGDFAGRGGFDGAGAFDMSDLLSQLFGGGGGGGGPMGGSAPGVRAELGLDLRTAVLGGVHQLTTSSGSLGVRIPPGVRDGETLRLRGQGGRVGGPPGSDLHLTLRVAEHPVFRREGDDLHVELPVTVGEAILGARIPVPTLEGAVQVRVPAGSQSGQKLRLRGKGVQRRGQPTGHLVVHLRVRVPDGLDPAALEALEQAYRGDVRGELHRAAAA